MQPFQPKKHNSDGPEDIIQKAIIARLKEMDWYVKVTHGNLWQSGLPDLYTAHRLYGQRWIECKNPLSYSFTPAQQRDFPAMTLAGVGIWILTGATDAHMKKLFLPANWQEYYCLWVNGIKPHM
jgi:hypothetical protein